MKRGMNVFLQPLGPRDNYGDHAIVSCDARGETLTPVKQALTPRGQEHDRPTPQTPDKRHRRTTGVAKGSRMRSDHWSGGGNSIAWPPPPPLHRKTPRDESMDSTALSVSVERRMREIDLRGESHSADPDGSISPPLGRPKSASYATLLPNRMSQATDNSVLSQETTTSQVLSRRLLTEFQEVRDLGQGSFGRVVLAREVSTGELFAIKALPHVAVAQPKRCHEYRALSAVRGAPHVVSLVDAWIEGNSQRTLYLQLQYCAGGSLAKALAERRSAGAVWREQEVLTFLGHVGLALLHLHDHGIAHVDVKPENVLQDHRGAYFLTDFGNAQFVDSSPKKPEETGTLVAPNQLVSILRHEPSSSQEEGDCRYVSLDMMNQKTHVKAGDVFSLGISLYEMMSGRVLPHCGDLFHQLRHRSSAIEQQLRSELSGRGFSDALIRLVLSMMHLDPQQRPTMVEVLSTPLLRPNNVSMSLLQAGATPFAPTAEETSLRMFHATSFEVAGHLLARTAIPPQEAQFRRRHGLMVGSPLQGSLPGWGPPSEPHLHCNGREDTWTSQDTHTPVHTRPTTSFK